ncbi:MAG TPA: TolC family protein, partial [Sphingobacteriaceae bacterium]
SAKVAATVALLLLGQPLMAQDRQQPIRASLDAVYDSALVNNLHLRASDLQVKRSKVLRGTWLNLPKTGVFVENEDINPQDPQGLLKIGVSQSIEWPGLYKARRELLEEQVKSVSYAKELRALEIKRDVQSSYYRLWYLQDRQHLYQRIDSIFRSLTKATVLRVKTGESAGLDSISAQARSREITAQLNGVSRDIESEQENLMRLTNSSTAFLPELRSLKKIEVNGTTSLMDRHPAIKLQRQNESIAAADIRIQRRTNMPTLDGRFFSQRLYQNSNPYSGFSVSVGIPLFGRAANRKSVQAAELEREYQSTLVYFEVATLQANYGQARQELEKQKELLVFYEGTGLKQAQQIISASNLAYRGGEISFSDLSQFLMQAIEIQRSYLEVLNEYNQAAIKLNYYVNR